MTNLASLLFSLCFFFQIQNDVHLVLLLLDITPSYLVPHPNPLIYFVLLVLFVLLIFIPKFSIILRNNPSIIYLLTVFNPPPLRTQFISNCVPYHLHFTFLHYNLFSSNLFSLLSHHVSFQIALSFVLFFFLFSSQRNDYFIIF